jgi:hypothetical protein
MLEQLPDHKPFIPIFSYHMPPLILAIGVGFPIGPGKR